MLEKLSTNFSYCFDGIVWNMLMDEQGNYLVLEIRDSDTHQVSFTALDLNKKEVLWDGLSFDENWWLGMTAVHKNVLLLHIYEDNMDPEPKGMIAFDIVKKQVIWQKESFIFLRIVAEELIGFYTENEERSYQKITLANGESTALEEEVAERIIKDRSAQQMKPSIALYPFHYKEGTDYFETCKRYLYNRFHKEAVTAMDYLETREVVVVSYYIEEEKLVNFLLIIDLEGNILYHAAIQKNISAVGMETFFIVKNQLIFVKEKNEINSFAL